MRVALFVTCLVDTLFPDVGKATVTVLERLGVGVVFPAEQTCCGQLHLNAGYDAEARALGRRFVEVFDGFDTVVAPSGSCVAHVRAHLPRLVEDDRGVPERTWELSQLLVDRLGATDLGARFPGPVTYHPTCHSSRSLGVGGRPLRLLQAVEGLELVELRDADECCGFGGSFAVYEEAVSCMMGQDRLADHQRAGTEVLTAADMSCLMHLDGLNRRQANPLRVLHVAELLVEALGLPATN